MNSLRWILNGVIALLILAVAVAGAKWMVLTKPDVPKQETNPIVPEVLAPALQALRDSRVELTGFGSVRPRILVDVTPQVAGEVIEKHPRFFSGEFISEQQVLFRVDPTDYELARDRAGDEIRLLDAKLQRLDITESSLANQLEIERERLELAEADLQRAQELIRRGAATQSELENAQQAVLGRRSQVTVTQQKLEEIPSQRIELQAQRDVSLVQQQQAEKDLERTVYRSPFIGRVIQCPLEVGERVQAGQECGTIYATQVMEVPVSLPAADLGWIDQDLLVASDEALWVDSQTGQAPNDQEVILAEVLWQAGASIEPLRWYGCVS
ncbi:MAG: HlyD family secretion protein, partial [Planctomycetota bacterium]